MFTSSYSPSRNWPAGHQLWGRFYYKRVIHFSFHPDLSAVSFIFFHFPLCSLFGDLFSLPLTLYSSRSPPLPIPNYVCCHGDSLHKGLTSYIRCTCMTENIPRIMQLRAGLQIQLFTLNMIVHLYMQAEWDLWIPPSKYVLAPHIYTCVPRNWGSRSYNSAGLSSRLVYVIVRHPVRISVWLLAFLTDDSLVFLSFPS
jgi:hypothetical protein